MLKVKGKMSIINNYNLLLSSIIIFAILYLSFRKNAIDNVEPFIYYNITPTEIIDNEYVNINQDPDNYYFNMRVGDTYGVDLNCNNVNVHDLLKWIDQDDPNILNEYVFKYDSSINILNPIHSPRVFKMLLRNLPQKHRLMSILRKCLYKPVRIS